MYISPALKQGYTEIDPGFALYRALLRQVRRLPEPDDRTNFGVFLKRITKRNSKLQGHRDIAQSLNIGYKALEALHDDRRKPEFLEHAAQWVRASGLIQSELSKAQGLAPLPKKPIYKRGEIVRACKSQPRRRSPLQRHRPSRGAISILDRPFPNISGRRHVPVLVSANRVPILRIRKPQPSSLSRYIRDVTAAREKRLTKTRDIEHGLRDAKGEERWDNLLVANSGVERDKEEMPWTRAPNDALLDIRRVVGRQLEKRKYYAMKMTEIVEKEQQLADQGRKELEKENRRQRRLRKRLAAEKKQRSSSDISSSNISTAEEDKPGVGVKSPQVGSQEATVILGRDGRDYVQPPDEEVIAERKRRKEEKKQHKAAKKAAKAARGSAQR